MKMPNQWLCHPRCRQTPTPLCLAMKCLGWLPNQESQVVYEYRCEACASKGLRYEFDIWKPIKDSSRSETCPDCGATLERVFRLANALTFQSFYDQTYNTEITSARQEKSLMKKHGHINGSEVFGKKYEAQVKHAKWKAKHSHTVRFGKAA